MPRLKLELAPKLQQVLTPQQIQYLKLLQLPALQLEQYIKQEIEDNPMLEEVREEGEDVTTVQELLEIPTESPSDSASDSPTTAEEPSTDEPPLSYEPERPDDDTLDYFAALWKESDSPADASDSDDENEPFGQQLRDVPTFQEDLLEQARFLDLSESEYILAEHIIGSIDEDGYLRRDLGEIVEEANEHIAEVMYERARQGQPSDELPLLTLSQAERVLRQIQILDPPGCASRTVQECLIAQLRARPERSDAEQLALRVLKEAFDELSRKHYGEIATKLGVDDERLRTAIDVIRRLNPKPGSGDTTAEATLTIIPDFIVGHDEETGELTIALNESNLPRLRLSYAYQQLRKRSAHPSLPKETRQWLHRKHEDAKFLLQALQQRKITMLKVMTAIAHLQRLFFEHGPAALRPLIYKDVAEVAGLDISTVCRVVNGKYVQTEYGIFELRYFFSEALTTDEGDEVSSRVIKEAIRQLIASEPKDKPLSDDKISKELKKMGYNVARRTVAKYREQLKIPVARLRREL